ncbi:hypothetical protein K438DRAFT_1818233 [Mycena galopus ATCC 62051]|nr:hypothetical protein K438DRAFT_1818233 [Mycena galopus ATCC 62051]
MDPSNVASVIRMLHMPTKVHSAYLVGSRLWGTHSAKSDIDLLIVIADPPSSAHPFQKSQHKGQYDATLLTETQFRDQVEAGSLIETLCCLIPKSEKCVLAHDNADNTRGLLGNDHLQTMRKWAEERGRRDREKAMKFWAKGGETREKGWKILRHAIATESVLHGLQNIVNEEKIDLRDVELTQEKLQRIVADGREDGDRAWLGLDWKDAKVALELRLERIRTTR